MWNLVPASEVRDQLRAAFGRWGLPGELRVDNGKPWGSRGNWPTELAMWAIGLGVTMTWNRPRQPQENGVIERSQGTANRWCEPWTCDTPEELQTRLERMDQIYRASYPYKAVQSRTAYYPGLTDSGHPYTIESESQLWDWSRITTHLSTYVVVRQVDPRGYVSIYNRNRYVGKIHQGKRVSVMYDPETNEWLFADAQGHYLSRKLADELSPQRVLDLDVTRR
jgi:transposase InsO family protein